MANGASLIVDDRLRQAPPRVFFGMATLATVVKRDLTGLYALPVHGRVRSSIIVASIINLFVHSTAAAAGGVVGR